MSKKEERPSLMLQKVEHLEANPTVMLARPKGSKAPFMNPERDLMHAWPLLHAEATSVVSSIYRLQFEEGELSEEDATRKLMVVDTISKFFMRFMNDAVGSVAGAFGNLKGLFKELNTPEKREIFSQYNAALTVAMPCLLYSTQAMAVGTGELPDNDNLDANSVINILHNLSDDTRRLVARELSDFGMIRSQADVSIALRTMDPYLPKIQAMQQLQSKARKDSNG